jgi:hypothetical protein
LGADRPLKVNSDEPPSNGADELFVEGMNRMNKMMALS